MADNIENRLQVGLGFKIDDVGGGLANLAKDADKINGIMEKLGQSMSKFENSSKNAGGTITKSFSEATNIMNQYQAGLINDAQAMKLLKDEQIRLNNEIKKAGENSKEYDNLVSQLAKVKKAYEKLDKEETKAIEEILKKEQEAAKQAEQIAEQQYKEAVERNKAETNAYDEEQRLRRKSAKASADYFRQIFQEQEEATRQELRTTTSAYKQAMNERKASSRILGDALSPVNTNYSNRLLTSAAQWSGAYALVREFQNLGREIVDIEYNTINNMRLMGDFSDELRDSLNASAAEIARNTGIMITDAQEIQGAWIRINEEYAKSPELLGEMAEITSKFMNVGEIENAESAVKLLNSTLLQFNLTTGDVAANAEEIANKFAYMADVTSMGTADEYAEGIAKMGANIKNMNGDVDDAIVLLSIVGDKLAKNGTEAGNSLNTFTAYMHRAKTITLFDSLQSQMKDLDVSLREGENGLKSFEDSLTAIATAYQRLKEEGNQTGMNEIIEALGATRQRATAQAMLEAISDGETLEKYYSMLANATAEGNYLEEQNEALMTTMSNQFKALVATLQEAGMHIANSGVIDGLTLTMNGVEGLLKVVNNVPQPFITGATAVLAYKTAINGLNKIGNVTGLTEKLAQSLRFGSEEQIKAANATRQNTDTYLNYQKSLFSTIPAIDRTAESYQKQLSALTNYELAVNNNNIALNSGSITIDQYNVNMDKAHKQYIKTVQGITASTRHTKEYTNANKVSMTATKQSIVLKQQEDLQNKKSLITLMSQNGYKKAGMLIDTARNAIQSITNALTTKGTAATIAGAVADKAAAVGKTVLAGATTALGVAMNFLLSPMVLITAAISALSWVTSLASKELESSKEKVDEYKNSISEATDRVSELKEKQRQSGLSGTEEAELDYLQRKIEAEKELLKIEQQKVANSEYKGSGALWWREDGKTDDINKAMSDFRAAQSQALYYQSLLNNPTANDNEIIQWTEKLSNANQRLSESALLLKTYYDYLNTNIKDGTWTGTALEQAKKDLSLLESMMPTVNELNSELEETSKSANLIDADNVKEFNNGISESLALINKYDEDIQKLIDGASSDDLLNMIDDYPDFANMIGKSTAEQIAYIRSLQSESGQSLLFELDSKISELEESKKILESEIANIKNQDSISDEDQKVLTEKNEQLQETINLLNEVQAKKDIVINVTTNLDDFNLGDLMNQMDSLAESTKSLVEAQNQLAQGAALSKDHLWELAMQYPELLYQANLFADGSVAGQQAAIDAILDMKNQEFNNTIDLKIAELEATRDFIQNILDGEQEKFNIIAQAEADNANGKLNTEAQVTEMLGKYNDIVGKQHTLAEQYKLGKTIEGGEARVDTENQVGEKTTGIVNETGLNIAEAVTNGSAAGVDGASKNANVLGNIFGKIRDWASNLASWVAKAFAGDTSGAGAVNGSGSSGLYGNTYRQVSYDSTSSTIDGKSITEWISVQKELLSKNVEAYKVQLAGINNAITNLNAFKNAGLTGVSNSYSDKGAQGGTGKSGEAAKAAEKAANAAEKAAKETEKIAEEIEKIAQQYVKNVESMQDRIAKALKKKYQEQYDERKKLLEKEHEARVQQIQDEIDKINGNTTQDKKSELERLQEKYEQWSKDDSTLGKARQKEYLDQIKELEKEIKIDELEKQLDEENEKYDQSIDKDSQFYDAILKKLDSQMTDEMLYREANDMIRNGKIDEITALLTKYDAQWDGWATLMGKTAGEIIAEEVALAIANYLDVVQGTITQDGGTHTNSITGGSSSASKNTSTSTHSGSSTGTTGGTVTTGSKVKINDTSTGMYYTSTSGGAVGNWSGYSGSYYVVNSNAGRVALARDNNVNNAIGWISKSKVTKLATGGYTGLGEGLAYLHAKERVLNARQTAAFENLIYNQLPKLERQSINGGNFGGTTNNFNKELVKVEVDTINNYDSADVTNMGDNLDRLVRVSLQKSGIRRSR